MKIKNIPNILTCLRIILIPFILFTLFTKNTNIAIILYFVAIITDFLDGFIARKYQIISNFGTCFDPVADKILILSMIFFLIYLEKINLFFSLLTIIRESLVSGLREFLVSHNRAVPVSFFAKTKTSLQMISIFLIILSFKFKFMLCLGNFIFAISSVFGVISAYQYIIKNKKILFDF